MFSLNRFIVFAVMWLVSFSVQATNVGGFISSDTTWTLANSPYVTTSGIIVQSGSTLTIEAGVEVQIGSNHSVTINGGLVARGTVDNEIRFTKSGTSNWSFIYLTDTATDAQYNINGVYQSGSILEYVIMEYGGGAGITNDGTLRIESTFPYLNYLTITNSGNVGMRSWSLSTGTFRVTNSTFSNNTYGGFYSSSSGTTYVLEALTIAFNSGERGIYITDRSAAITLTNSTISNNTSGGLYLYNYPYSAKSSTISNNVISSNTGGNYAGFYINIYHASGESTVFSSNTIKNNTASSSYGGGYFGCSYGDGCTFINNLIQDNTAISSIGGIGFSGSSITTTIANNQFINNTAGSYAGGINFSGSSTTTTIANNQFISNTAGSYAGAGVVYGSATVFQNNVVFNNTATTDGGMVFSIYSSGGRSSEVKNNIFAGNAASTSGAFQLERYDTRVYNNLIYNNVATKGAAITFYNTSTLRQVYGNTITANRGSSGMATSIIYVNGNVSFIGNNLFGNAQSYALYNNNAASTYDITATGNWWGTSDTSVIETSVYHILDDATKTQADYSSPVSSLITSAPISPPTGLAASSNTGQVTLTWNANAESDVVGYRAYYGADILNMANVVDVGSATTYTFSGIAPGTYLFGVTAYDTSYVAANDVSTTIVNDNQTSGNESWFATLSASPSPAPNISLSASNYAFGNQNNGSITAQVFTITNSGTANLTMGILSLNGNNADQFSLSATACNSVVIATSGNCGFNVSFVPTNSGDKTAAVTIPSDDPDTASTTITLTGTGVTAEALLATASSTLAFGSVVSGSNASSQVSTLTNSGTIDMMVSNITITGSNASQFSMVSTCGSAVSSGGGTCTLTVTYATSVVGNHSATLGFATNDTNNASVNIALTGTTTQYAPLQISSLSVDKSAGVVPMATTFALTTSGGSGTNTYRWDFGDSSNADTNQNPTHTFSSAGTYTVTVTVTDASDSSNTTTGSLSIIAASAPAAYSPVGISRMSTGTSSGVAPLSSTFAVTASGGSSSYNYSWNFGDNSSADTNQNSTHIFSSVGTYIVTVTVTDQANSSNTAQGQLSLIVVDAPSAYSPVSISTLTATPSSGVAPLSSNFAITPSGGSGSYLYRWDFDDSSSADTNQNPSHTFSTTGTYAVTVTVTDTNDPNNTTTGSLSVTAVAAATTYSPVTVSALSASPSSGIAPFSSTMNVSATGGSGNYTYRWDFDDSSPVDTSQNPSHNFANVGAYAVTVIVTDTTNSANTTTGTLSMTAVATPTPYSPITITSISTSASSGAVPLTTGFEVSVSGGSGDYSYGWDFGDSTPLETTPSPSHVYSAAGTYTATMTVTDSADSNKTTQGQLTVIVVDAPTAYSPVGISLLSTDVSSGVAPFATRFNVMADGGSGQYQYAWDFDDASGDMTEQTPAHTFNSAGEFIVSVTVTDSNDTTNMTMGQLIVKTINPLADYTLLSIDTLTASPSSGVAPMDTTFAVAVSGGSGNYLYRWDFDDNSETNLDQNPSHQFVDPGMYMVTVTVTDAEQNLNRLSASIGISIVAEPVLYSPVKIDRLFADAHVGLAPQLINFNVSATGGSGQYTLAWDFGDGQTESGFTINHTYPLPGDYVVTVIVTDVNDSNNIATGILAVRMIQPIETLSASINANILSTTAPFTVALTANIEGDAAPYQLNWIFGDGSTETSTTNSNTTQLQHIFNNAGAYEITVMISSANGITMEKVRVDTALPLTINENTSSVPVNNSTNDGGDIDNTSGGGNNTPTGDTRDSSTESGDGKIFAAGIGPYAALILLLLVWTRLTRRK